MAAADEVISQDYVSNELSHFVGRSLRTDDDRFNLLLQVLQSGIIMHPPFRRGESGNISIERKKLGSSNELVVPQMVCFCDIPKNHLEIHTRKYSKFGLSLSKRHIARAGGAPVYYIPRGTRVRELGVDQDLRDQIDDAYERQDEATIKKLWPRLSEPRFITRAEQLDRLMWRTKDLLKWAGNKAFFMGAAEGRDTPPPQLIETPEQSLKSPPPYSAQQIHELECLVDQLFAYFKFFDEERSDCDPDNYYMEREWRVIGNVEFTLEDVKRIYVPARYLDEVRKSLPTFAGTIEVI